MWTLSAGGSGTARGGGEGVEGCDRIGKFVGKTGGMDVTKAFLNYVRPLVGALPEYPGLTIKRAKPG